MKVTDEDLYVGKRLKKITGNWMFFEGFISRAVVNNCNDCQAWILIQFPFHKRVQLPVSSHLICICSKIARWCKTRMPIVLGGLPGGYKADTLCRSVLHVVRECLGLTANRYRVQLHPKGTLFLVKEEKNRRWIVRKSKTSKTQAQINEQSCL